MSKECIRTKTSRGDGRVFVDIRNTSHEEYRQERMSFALLLLLLLLSFGERVFRHTRSTQREPCIKRHLNFPLIPLFGCRWCFAYVVDVCAFLSHIRKFEKMPAHNVHLATFRCFDSLWQTHYTYMIYMTVMKAICVDDGNETDMLARITVIRLYK